MGKPSVLLIDDDVEFCEFTAEYLGLEGFEIEACYDGETGITLATTKQYDVIILDILLPTIDGFKVLRSLHSYLETPIIMLTASGKDIDHIVGLELGAEDYIDKPCNSKVLAARIKAVLGRTQHEKDAHEKENLAHGAIEINYKTMSVLVHRIPLKLTLSEFKVFDLLFTHLGETFSKEEIAKKALGRTLLRHDRSIDAHVINLRTKLRKQDNVGFSLNTVHGFGYKLSQDD